VVTYNSEEVVQSCVEACLGAQLDVLVVDNASIDRTVALAQAAGATVLENVENRGFAGGVNQGLLATQSELVLILNPDVRIASDLEPLVAAARQHGIAGGRLTDPQGVTQEGFTIRRFPTSTVLALELVGVNRLWKNNPWNLKYRYLDRDLSLKGQADQPAGAFLMVRRDVWEALGGMDERFWPIWFEDVDFCRRASMAGYEIQYVPESRAFHSGGHSIKKIDGASKQLYWYDSLLRYAGKHFRPGEVRILCLAGVFGALLRAVVGVPVAMIQERSLRPVSSTVGILKFLGRRLVSRPPSGLAQRPGSDY